MLYIDFYLSRIQKYMIQFTVFPSNIVFFWESKIYLFVCLAYETYFSKVTNSFIYDMP